MATKKLIEVALPLEKINAESAREKSIRHGHPSTLHLWWARRPLAAARAVIWSSLVDDPSSHPELYPTEEEQNKERQRLFKILESLVVWENSNDPDVLNMAKAEILKSTNGNPPALLDPFAGGGSIPLEALRLGLGAIAHDLNPVAVMINKAIVEIPQRFAGQSPVNPEARVSSLAGSYYGASGLAEDIKYYGEWLRKKAFKKVGALYPKVILPNEQGGNEATVIAWIWTRTVKCPNPACRCNTPLIRSFNLSKKKGAEVYIHVEFDQDEPVYTVKKGKSPLQEGTVNRSGAKCLKCGATIDFPYIRSEGLAKRISTRMAAIVAEGKKGRIYLSPNEEHRLSAQVDKPDVYPNGPLPYNPRNFNTPIYGMTEFADHFTNRQLVLLTTVANLIDEIRLLVEKDAIEGGLRNDHISLADGGSNARAYGEAIAVYLAFALDRLAMTDNSLARWNAVGQKVQHCFGRQALPMLWDFAECNPFCSSTGSIDAAVFYAQDALPFLPFDKIGKVSQMDAQSDCGLRNIAVSTDPPYYDNISYADLADFFYIWMRHGLRNIYPNLFNTMLVPKSEELIASQYRHEGGAEEAKKFFEDGMLLACTNIYKYVRDDVPVTIYYAYKQTDAEESDGVASSGWETMLSSIIKAGFSITGTWPLRTEMATRQIAQGSNALASSIVLVCRKRREDAPQVTRRNMVNILRQELRPALQKLQESNIAPVDLAQSAIGPGMGVFSRYRKVLEADGTAMSVRSALRVINEEIDLYFNEQVGDLDVMSRFCIDLYTQNAFNDIKFGEADILARAKGTSVAALASHEIVYAKAGIVHLIERTDLSEKIDNNESCIWMLTQQLTKAMATGGVEACAKAIFMMLGSNAERAKDLAYRLYTIAEQKKWSTEAFAYNALVVAWPDIQSRAAMMKRETPEQLDLFSMGLLNPNS